MNEAISFTHTLYLPFHVGLLNKYPMRAYVSVLMQVEKKSCKTWKGSYTEKKWSEEKRRSK